MVYGITQVYSGKQPFLEIDADEFSAIKSARRRMYDILYIQEKFAYLIENYYELETELLASDFRGMHFPNVHLDETLDAVHLFIRRITNLLTTARLYTDHTKQDLNALAQPEASLSDEFSNRLKKAYDQSFGYRLCDALRNYIQHCGIPLWGVKRCSKLLKKDGDKKQIVHYLELPLDTERLSSDSQLKATVRSEIAKIDGGIDLRPLLREYVCNLAEVHEWLQSELVPKITMCAEKIRESIARFRSFVHDQAADGIAIVHDENERKAREHLATDAADRFFRLKSKHTHISKLYSHFVTSASIE